MARERETKLTSLNTLPAILRTKGLRNFREKLAGGGPAQPRWRQEAGGRGKGANSAPEMASPTKLQTGSQFLTKDFLRFWMDNIRWEGRS